MTTVTVFRHVPPPIIGSCGIYHDRAFEVLEEELDWLEACGTVVERFDPATETAEVERREAVRQMLAAEGDRCLPLILGDGAIVSHGTYPSRTQLAHLVSVCAREHQTAAPAHR